jgi:hypothetical protein
MIAFGTSITSPEAYRRYAEPGIRRAAEPNSEVYAFAASGSIFRSYNLLLDTAAARDDLEALVLVHQDAEIVDADFCDKVRRALRDPDVGVVGCVGARRPQHRLVGRLRYLGVIYPPLRRARRR